MHVRNILIRELLVRISTVTLRRTGSHGFARKIDRHQNGFCDLDAGCPSHGENGQDSGRLTGDAAVV